MLNIIINFDISTDTPKSINHLSSYEN